MNSSGPCRGCEADPIVWPAPHLYDIGGVINYGFQNEAMLSVRIRRRPISAALRSSSAPLLRGCLHPRGRQVRAQLPIAAAATPAAPATRAILRQGAPERATESPWPARYGLAKSGDPALIVEAKA